MDHKIIIIEGQDRLGKSTCIKSMITDFENLGYQVVTMYGDHRTAIQKTEPEIKPHFMDLYKNNPNAYNFGGASFEVLSYSLRNLFSVVQKPTVMIFDRLTLSNIAYGMVLRKELFIEFYRGLNDYIKHMNEFEKFLNKLATTYLWTFITDYKFTGPDDDSNPYISVSSDTMNQTKGWFEAGHSKSKISNKRIDIVQNMDNYFDTMKIFNSNKSKFLEYAK